MSASAASAVPGRQLGDMTERMFARVGARERGGEQLAAEPPSRLLSLIDLDELFTTMAADRHDCR